MGFAQNKSLVISTIFPSDKTLPPIAVFDSKNSISEKLLYLNPVVLEEDEYYKMEAFVIKTIKEVLSLKNRKNEEFLKLELSFNTTNKKFQFYLGKEQSECFLEKLALYAKEQIKNTYLSNLIDDYIRVISDQ